MFRVSSLLRMLATAAWICSSSSATDVNGTSAYILPKCENGQQEDIDALLDEVLTCVRPDFTFGSSGGGGRGRDLQISTCDDCCATMCLNATLACRLYCGDCGCFRRDRERELSNGPARGSSRNACIKYMENVGATDISDEPHVADCIKQALADEPPHCKRSVVVFEKSFWWSG